MQFIKQLPIGVSTFSRFAQENLIYVDKTKLFSLLPIKLQVNFFFQDRVVSEKAY